MRKHFTLIELLIVIAIIAILAGMLLPAVSRAKDMVDSMACLNQHKQRFSYAQMYINDFNDQRPIFGGHWLNDEKTFQRKFRGNLGFHKFYDMPLNLADCTWTKRKNPDSIYLLQNKKGGEGQYINSLFVYSSKSYGSFSEKVPSGLYNISQVKKPSFTAFLYDGLPLNHLLKNFSWSSGDAPAARHENFTVVPIIYFDGHGVRLPVPEARNCLDKNGYGQPTFPNGTESYRDKYFGRNMYYDDLACGSAGSLVLFRR